MSTSLRALTTTAISKLLLAKTPRKTLNPANSILLRLRQTITSHPADMGEREWYIVLQNNSILHGNYVRELVNGQRKVERAMYPGT
jgi:hypothetical protein